MATQGEESNGQELRENQNESEPFSEMTQNTLDKIKQNHQSRKKSESFSTFRDLKSPGYEWLLPGWVAEERQMKKTGRMYRYYYDPAGQLYRSQAEVLAAWDLSGLVVIDL